MNANDLSGYEVEIRRNTTQIKVSDSPDLRDHELIIAHLLGLNDSGQQVDPDVRNALVHGRYTDAARLIRSGP
jgi:hypothetical protein